MRTSLDVDEKTAEKLRELAAADGVSIEQLLTLHIPGLKGSNGSGVHVGDVRLAFDKWVESFAEDALPLSDEAISRASIYRDR